MFSNPKLYPSKKCKKKSSTVKGLNVDKFLYRKPKHFFPRNIAFGLHWSYMQIDSPCVHVFKSKALSINKCKKKSSTVKVLNVDKFLYRKPKHFFPRNIAFGLHWSYANRHSRCPCYAMKIYQQQWPLVMMHDSMSKLLSYSGVWFGICSVVDSGWFGAIVLVWGFLIRLVTDSGWFGIVAVL